VTTPIQAVNAVNSLSALTSTASASAPSASSGSDFASVLGKGLDALQDTQTKADSLAVKAATGDLTDISTYTVAASQASLAISLASTLRTKAVDAFNEIMGMQA
jgi:flagellar hook-basal body complex protein FliE